MFDYRKYKQYLEEDDTDSDTMYKIAEDTPEDIKKEIINLNNEYKKVYGSNLINVGKENKNTFENSVKLKIKKFLNK